MPLTQGTRLGAYEILALVGSGGMGEVYKARDPRLGRDVAIKVLPPGVSTDPERLHRFEQEARAAAALNHPNILAIHDIGMHDGTPYIVSELLDGESVRDRLRGGALPVRKAVEYAVQVARGLAVAHDKGIVHRDLKPENVFVTADGHVKILDFGLAKLTQKEASSAMDATQLPTTPNTDPGLVLGTVGYMAPEQVRGLPADHRSDIFAFGALLYEMLSGARAFRRHTSMDTMSAILREDPPDLPLADRHIPLALGRIVDRCLEKSPASRFQSTGDLAFALESLTSHSSAAEAVAVVTSRKRAVPTWALVAAGGVVAGAVVAAAAFAWFRPTPPDVRAIRFFLSTPDGWTLPLQTQGNAAAGALAASPDGRRIAFVARNAAGSTMIWTRALDTLVAQSLAGTEGGVSPFWSPDSRALGFFAQGKLKKVDVAGGPPVTLCDAAPGVSAAWSPEGVIVFSAAGGTALQQVSAAGGIPSAATTLGEGETGHARPFFLPDGRHFVYRVTTGGAQRAPAYVTALGSSERTRLMDVESTNVLYSNRHLLFLRETTLMAQPFDPERLALVGDAFPVVEHVQTSGAPSYGFFSASNAGVLVYQTGTAGGTPQLMWLDRTGRPVASVGSAAAYGDLVLSRDGKKAAVTLTQQGGADVWLVDLDRGGLPTRFTFNEANDISPIWSPDGTRIVFASNRNGVSSPFDIYQKASSGTGAEEVVLADRLAKLPTSWSADGRFILYTSAAIDLWILPLSGDKKPFPFLQTRFTETQGQFSPDGRWIAYVSNESGLNEVYVAPFDDTGGVPAGKWQVSTNGGGAPRWRPDGKEIFFLTSDSMLMAAEVSARGSALEVGAVKPLFSIRPPATPRSNYQVSTDGRRFLVNMGPVQTAAPTPITVVLNWTADLKK
jgi:Tol biopolymer transport system component